MFDLDPIGAVFLIIAVLWLIAAVAYGVMTADMRGQDGAFGTALGKVKISELSTTAMTSPPILRCSTAQTPAELLSDCCKPVTQIYTKQYVTEPVKRQ